MRLIGLMPARNEDWVIGLSARVALQWVDQLMILDHASTDRTREILCDLAGEVGHERIVWFSERDAEWREMQHRQFLLQAARAAGATHIAIIDADEIATANCINAARCAADQCIQGYIAQLPGYNMRGGISRYHADGLWAHRWFSAAFKDHHSLSWQGDGYHHREPHGRPLHAYKAIPHGTGGVMHLWGASERRLKAKHALYKCTERLRFPQKPVDDIEAMYNLWRAPEFCRGYGDQCAEWSFASAPSAWWDPYQRWMGYLHVDAEPWQEAQVRRLVREHGRDAFRGMDLFGVEA